MVHNGRQSKQREEPVAPTPPYHGNGCGRTGKQKEQASTSPARTWAIMQANAHGYRQRAGTEGLAGSGVDREKEPALAEMIATYKPTFVCIT